MKTLAIIIVNWNVKSLLANCLRSVQDDLAGAGQWLSAEIWVVDNASTDGSVEMVRQDFPQVKLIASDKNLGFAGGNNAALRAIGFDRPNISPDRLPEAVLLLNPDTIVHTGALVSLMEFLAHTPQAGMAGAQLVYGDGSFQHGAFAFPGLWQLAIELLPLPGRLVESRLNGRYLHSQYEKGEPFEIGHPLGAAMCVRREAILETGLLDAQYHMYVEEVDWSMRMARAGWRAYSVPAAVVTHLGGQSTGQVQSSSFIHLWTSRYRFYRKFYAPLKVWLARHIVRAGMQRHIKADTQAAQRGELPAGALAERVSAYRQVINIWQDETAS